MEVNEEFMSAAWKLGKWQFSREVNVMALAEGIQKMYYSGKEPSLIAYLNPSDDVITVGDDIIINKKKAPLKGPVLRWRPIMTEYA